MLERAIVLRPALEAALHEEGNDDLVPNAAAWNYAGDLVTILRPFLEATEMLSGTTYITSSCVFPVYRQLFSHVSVQIALYTPGRPI
jgi:hypothetical protein